MIGICERSEQVSKAETETSFQRTHQGDTGAAETEATERPEERDRDDLTQDGNIERVAEESAEDLATARLEVAAVVDVRKLLLEDEQDDAEVQEGEGDHDRVPVEGVGSSVAAADPRLRF